MVHTVVCVLFFNKEKNVSCLCHCVKLNFLAFNCKLQSLNFNKYIDSGFKTHVAYIYCVNDPWVSSLKVI